MGCDGIGAALLPRPPRFNSRTPCGVRPLKQFQELCQQKFQFTHPVWGATSMRPVGGLTPKFQSTHPVWGATPIASKAACTGQSFNSRTPCGVRRQRACLSDAQTQVSIHAPRVGCDLIGYLSAVILDSFNSRTPCGVRLTMLDLSEPVVTFQFTHPVWGATLGVVAPAAGR